MTTPIGPFAGRVLRAACPRQCGKAARLRAQMVRTGPMREALVRRQGSLLKPEDVNRMVDDVVGQVSRGAQAIRIDLADVTAADSKAAAALLVCAAMCRRRSVRLRVEVSASVRVWLDLVHAWPLLEQAA